MIDKGIKYEDRTGFFLGGGGYDIGGGGNPANAPSSGRDAPGPGDTGGEGGNNPKDNSTSQFGGNDGVTYKGPAELGVTTRKVNTIDMPEPERDTGLERQREINEDALKKLKKVTYQDVQTKIPPYIPYAGYINTGLNVLGEFGFKKNLDFFAENVAGKHGYGYDYEDFEQYMDDRLSGKVGAYGNEEQGENALREIGGGNDRVDTSGILENLLQPGIFPGEEPQFPVPLGFTYTPYSNQVVVAPGSQGLASLTGGQGFLSNII